MGTVTSGREKYLSQTGNLVVHGTLDRVRRGSGLSQEK